MVEGGGRWWQVVERILKGRSRCWQEIVACRRWWQIVECGGRLGKMVERSTVYWWKVV